MKPTTVAGRKLLAEVAIFHPNAIVSGWLPDAQPIADAIAAIEAEARDCGQSTSEALGCGICAACRVAQLRAAYKREHPELPSEERIAVAARVRLLRR